MGNSSGRSSKGKTYVAGNRTPRYLQKKESKSKTVKTVKHDHFVLNGDISFEDSLGEFALFPNEIIVGEILSRLTIRDLVSISAVSRAYYHLISDDVLWKTLYMSTEWLTNPPSEIEKMCCWKRKYVQRFQSFLEQSARSERKRNLFYELKGKIKTLEHDKANALASERSRHQQILRDIDRTVNFFFMGGFLIFMIVAFRPLLNFNSEILSLPWRIVSFIASKMVEGMNPNNFASFLARFCYVLYHFLAAMQSFIGVIAEIGLIGVGSHNQVHRIDWYDKKMHIVTHNQNVKKINDDFEAKISALKKQLETIGDFEPVVTSGVGNLPFGCSVM